MRCRQAHALGWRAFLAGRSAPRRRVRPRRRSAHVTGTASYRERIALPPGAVFEAVLEDVSAADAPAQRARPHRPSHDPGNPPFDFEIDLRPGSVEPGRQLFGPGAGLGRPAADLRLGHHEPGADRRARRRRRDLDDQGRRHRRRRRARRRPPIGAHGLRLPASFVGELPCADCDAVRYRLNLWPDQVFHLRRTWEGKDCPRNSIGRWSVDPDRRVLDAARRRRGAASFQILGADRLRLLGARRRRERRARTTC